MPEKILIIIFFVILLLIGVFALKRYNYLQKITKAIHSLNTEYFVKAVLISEDSKRNDLLKIHSEETKKVSDYFLAHGKNEEKTVNFFIKKGWYEGAVRDAIIWKLNASFLIVALYDEKPSMTEKEALDTFKEAFPNYWKEEYSRVLLEELKLKTKL